MPLRVSPHKHTSVTDGEEGVARVGLWDASLKQERRQVAKFSSAAFLLITVCMFAFLPIYFGAYYRQTENASRVSVIVVDLDSQAASLSSSSLAPAASTTAYTAVLGPLVVASAESYLTRKGHVNASHWTLGYQFPSSEEMSQFSLPVQTAAGTVEYTQGLNVSDWAKEKVLNQDVFGVVIVNGNATLSVLDAVATGATTFDPTGAVTYYYEEARNFYTTNQYLVEQITEMLQSAFTQGNTQMARTVLQEAVAGGGVALLNPSVAGSFSSNSHNLHPFDQLSGTAPTTAGAIYLIIFTFLISLSWKGMFTPIRSKLTLGSEVFLKLFVPILGYFWISLMYSLVSLAFHVSFTRSLGHVGFFVYWLLNWVTMTALGLVMETMLEILGMMFFPFFLVFWVIWNVSVAFLDIADQAHFYSYGFAFPVWNNVDAGKCIMFGTKNHLAQNFGVNLGWTFAFGIILAVLTVRQRHAANRQEAAVNLEKSEKQTANRA